MNAERVAVELSRMYPGKQIKRLPENDPLEVIAELGGTAEEGLAIAVIDRSAPHYHKRATETYEIQEGSLTVHLGDRVVALEPGDTLTIQPGQIHWAEGHATRLLVRSRPPWTQGDHILCEKPGSGIERASS